MVVGQIADRMIKDPASLAARIESYFDRLWPLNRSILGPAYRASLDILSELVPYERLKYPTGLQAFDWTVPLEWDVKEAYIIGPDSRKFCDVSQNNLHLVSYSVPFSGTLSLEELKKHLHSYPDQPGDIPYVTSYYRPYWGFCLSHDELQSLKPGEYQVKIGATHTPGHLEVGEFVLKGESDQEVFFSSYLCHPSMANNELSGPLVVSFLAELLRAQQKKLRFTYRFVLNPETIGSICYLSTRGEHFKSKLKAGYVVTCIGDHGALTYKRSRRRTSEGDRVAELLLKSDPSSRFIEFDPGDGSDERQYCSLGFDLPVGSLMRTTYNQFPQYHTSSDNKDAISFDKLAEAVWKLFDFIQLFESNRVYQNMHPCCEPQLGKRGLYPTTSGAARSLADKVKAMCWVLNFGDGKASLLDIAERSGLEFRVIAEAASDLARSDLLREVR